MCGPRDKREGRGQGKWNREKREKEEGSRLMWTGMAIARLLK